MTTTTFNRHLAKWAATLCVTGAALSAGAAFAQNVQYAPGKAFFDTRCAVCHQAGGKGQDGLAPPLTELPGHYATNAQGRTQLGLTVLNGMFGTIAIKDKSYNFKMPSFRGESDEDLANVLNYLVFDVSAKHAGAKPFTAAEVKALRATQMDGAQVRAHRDVALKSLGL
ncbi:cytochrome c class I [Paraburkholderia atlantica]|uniref:Cytochrome c class I n=1 Tax=Paraburkholderia atlantica TaxID=2654982 RepID=D5W8B1_PARAM|nr:cytochrome c [Paraburkholderia atlantica]ADG15656.1 cytochrome c class I [Paraburkholderia atlantica]